MTRSILIGIIFLASCQNKGKDQKIFAPNADTAIKSKPLVDSLKPNAVIDSAMEIMANNIPPGWDIVNDSIAKWAPDQFSYFIQPRRKKEPGYPYFIKANLDGNGETDLAALIHHRDKHEFAIAILRNYNTHPTLNWWKTDIDLCAVSVYPKGKLDGMEGEHIDMKSDGIGIEYFETSSFVLYWNGKEFKRVWTGD
jgi:hypothetical protein